MTDPADPLAGRLEGIRRALAAVANDRPTPEQIAEWNTADKAMAQRIRLALPGVPLHHAYAVLQALRVTERLDAAVAPAGVAPATDEAWPSRRAGLRDDIAAALYERERPPRDPHWPDVYAADREVFEGMADAVLPVLYREWPWLRAEAEDAAAVLPASVDRADVLREAADIAERLMDERYGPDCSYAIGGLDVARELRRLAGEPAAAEPADETQAPCGPVPGQCGPVPGQCGPVPGQCDAEAGEPCPDHEREQAHAEGEHCFCGPECEGVPTGLPLLFWDESEGVIHHDGRITLPVIRAANLAQYTPAGQLILQMATARALRRALTTALNDDAAAQQPKEVRP